MPLRLLLADDHAIVRQGLKSLLESSDCEIVAEAGNGNEAIQLAERTRPDVAILDVSMPLLNGIDATLEITKVSPRTRIILLTMYPEGRNVIEGLRAGARGIVLKVNAIDELLRAIQTVSKGSRYLSPDVSDIIVDGYAPVGELPQQKLSPRERQVLQLIAEGKTTKAIASVLGTSIATADSHRGNIMDKLDIHDTAGLVRYAVREGLIHPWSSL